MTNCSQCVSVTVDDVGRQHQGEDEGSSLQITLQEDTQQHFCCDNQTWQCYLR